MKSLIAVLVLVGGCYFGVSAARMTGQPDVYCEPVHFDVQICRDDSGRTWRCVDERGYWVCKER